ncbi:hypothetical protein D3C84_1199370 [compost metagenome]
MVGKRSNQLATGICLPPESGLKVLQHSVYSASVRSIMIANDNVLTCDRSQDAGVHDRAI